MMPTLFNIEAPGQTSRSHLPIQARLGPYLGGLLSYEMPLVVKVYFLILTLFSFTGIPTRVTLAPSKCLTKIACELVRDDPQYGDVLDLTAFTSQQLDEALTRLAIDAASGIGRNSARLLRNYGTTTSRHVRH